MFVFIYSPSQIIRNSNIQYRINFVRHDVDAVLDNFGILHFVPRSE